MTCVASFGALCPATLGPDMTLPSLGPGRSLTLTYAVDVPGGKPRRASSTRSRSSSRRDVDPSDNSASVTAVAIDGRNGAYKAYAANGRVYDLTIDFDAMNYTMTVDGAPVQKTFAAGAGEYIVAGTQRLRTAADLVIGNHDFGTGLVPVHRRQAVRDHAGRRRLQPRHPQRRCRRQRDHASRARRGSPATCFRSARPMSR